MSRRTQLRVLLGLTVVWALFVGWRFVEGRTHFTVAVVDDEGAPVPGAQVQVDGSTVARTDAQGHASLAWSPSRASLQLSAPGFLPTPVHLYSRPVGSVTATIEPRRLRGVVVDAKGLPVADVSVSAGLGRATSDSDGAFTVRGAEPGPVAVRRPAWAAADFTWDGGPGVNQLTISPKIIKAVHVTGDAASLNWNHFLDMADTTELNAIMLDLKDEYGQVWYDTKVDLAVRIGAVKGDYDLASLVRSAKDHGLYLIGRIVAFEDPIAALRDPEIAVWDSATGAPLRHNGQYFLDPTDPVAQDYALDLAKEACSVGMDEIQFDYVRFPDNRPESAVFDGGTSAAVRVATIRDFLDRARTDLHALGCAVGADVFGFTTTATDDGGIGQQWEDMASAVDVVSPMVYPSHYGKGWFGYQVPNDHPADVVRRALADGMKRLDNGTVVRPWLQDFGYSSQEVRQEIDAAEARGLGWMLWNAASSFSVDALGPGGQSGQNG